MTKINIKNKKTYIWTAVIIMMVVAIVYYFISLNQTPKEISQCESATKVASDAVDAWGNSDDLGSDEYRASLEPFFTDDAIGTFLRPRHMDIEDRKSSTLVVQGITCETDQGVALVTVDVRTSKNSSNLSSAELSLKMIKKNGNYLIDDFVENYSNVKKVY